MFIVVKYAGMNTTNTKTRRDKMKLKDYKGTLDYVLIKIPKPLVKEHSLPKDKMYIKSGWIRGLWLMAEKQQDGRIYPLTFNDFSEIEDIEVLDEN
jgi:hypothetical protein